MKFYVREWTGLIWVMNKINGWFMWTWFFVFLVMQNTSILR